MRFRRSRSFGFPSARQTAAVRADLLRILSVEYNERVLVNFHLVSDLGAPPKHGLETCPVHFWQFQCGEERRIYMDSSTCAWAHITIAEILLRAW